MAVKLHGIRGGAGRNWAPAPITPASTAAVAHAGRPAVPGPVPLGAPAPSPRKVRPPLTLGRVLYFLVLMGGLGAGGHWLWMYAVYVRAVGVLERDVDRLAPREAGRILRVAVQPGDAVHKGQPLVWLDYAVGARVEGQGFISDQAARAGAERQRVAELERRRHEVSERQALLRADIAALHARERGLRQQRDAAARAEEAAARLERAGAATTAEVLRLSQQVAAIDQEQAVALADARQKERADRALDEEGAQLDRAIAIAKAVPPPAEEPGIITAPRDGVVAWIAHRPGEVVGPQSPVVLLRGGPLRVRAYVLPKDARSLSAGLGVRVELPSGEALPGVVARQHLLASSVEEGRAPALRDPALAGEPVMPFLVADVDLPNLPSEQAERLAVGAPCEVLGRRSWVRSLLSLVGRR